MTLKKQCYACRKWKLWFLVKQRSFIFPRVSTVHPIKSNDELCAECFEKTKDAVFGSVANEILSDNLINNGKDNTTEGTIGEDGIEG